MKRFTAIILAFLLTAVFYGIGFFPFQPTHSDGNGYYMYLPAFFVYHDPGMHFLDQLAEEGLELRWKVPDGKISLQLDAQKTYRVFENLFANLEKISYCDILCYLCSPKVLPNGKLFMIVSIKSFPK